MEVELTLIFELAVHVNFRTEEYFEEWVITTRNRAGGPRKKIETVIFSKPGNPI